MINDKSPLSAKDDLRSSLSQDIPVPDILLKYLGFLIADAGMFLTK